MEIVSDLNIIMEDFSLQRHLQFVLMSFSQQDQFIGLKVVIQPSHGKP